MRHQVGVDPVDYAGIDISHLEQGGHPGVSGTAIDPDHVSHAPDTVRVGDDHGHACFDVGKTGSDLGATAALACRPAYTDKCTCTSAGRQLRATTGNSEQVGGDQVAACSAVPAHRHAYASQLAQGQRSSVGGHCGAQALIDLGFAATEATARSDALTSSNDGESFVVSRSTAVDRFCYQTVRNNV